MVMARLPDSQVVVEAPVVSRDSSWIVAKESSDEGS